MILIIKNSGKDFDIEKFIEEKNLPNEDTNVITNEIIKVISESRFFKEYFQRLNSENSAFRRYFNFDIRRFEKY